MTKCIERLKNSVASMDPPLRVAQSRLKKRLRRPEVELCNDAPHNHLIEEVKELMKMIKQLENKLEDSNTALTELFQNKDRLDNDIRVKKNTIMIDQQKCMSQRKHFPYIIVNTRYFS